MGSVVGRIHDERISGDAKLVEIVEHIADVLVVIDHRIMIGRLPTPGLSEARFFRMRKQMHVRGVEPDKEWLAGAVLPLDEILGGIDEFFIAGFHTLGGQRSGVLDLLLAYLAPALLLRRVVLILCPGMNYAARADVFPKARKVFFRKIVVHFRLFLGVEVVQIAKEFIETVDRRQELVEIPRWFLPNCPVA